VLVDVWVVVDAVNGVLHEAIPFVNTHSRLDAVQSSVVIHWFDVHTCDFP
jgi:hypothetical protein